MEAPLTRALLPPPPLPHHTHPVSLLVGACLGQANKILGLDAGDIFVQRNVGNQALHHDMNVL